jgi:hypothetical protein
MTLLDSTVDRDFRLATGDDTNYYLKGLLPVTNANFEVSNLMEGPTFRLSGSNSSVGSWTLIASRGTLKVDDSNIGWLVGFGASLTVQSSEVGTLSYRGPTLLTKATNIGTLSLESKELADVTLDETDVRHLRAYGTTENPIRARIKFVNGRLVDSVKLQNAILTLEGEVIVTLAPQDVSWTDSQATRVYVVKVLKGQEPVPGASVNVYREGIGDPLWSGTTDQSGQVLISFTFDDTNWSDIHVLDVQSGQVSIQSNLSLFRSTPIVVVLGTSP